jgi:hypothetical protein
LIAFIVRLDLAGKKAEGLPPGGSPTRALIDDVSHRSREELALADLEEIERQGGS